MKILMTGLSPLHCNKGNRLQYSSVPQLYAECLRWAGHEVDHREWEVGEDLTKYDVAMIAHIPWNSINARHVYTVCDVIGRAKQSGVGLVFMVDDWQFRGIHQSVKSLNKDSNRLFTSVKGRTNREWAEFGPGREMVDFVLNAMAEYPWPTTLVPAFEWGDHTLLKPEGIPAREVRYLDPTVFQRYDADRAPAEDRKRTWVLGTLSDQRTWIEKLGLSWDVDYYGTKPSKAEQHVKEPELVQIVAKSWGNLCPRYPHAGGGWWRTRYIYSAVARSIMLADPQEVAPLGEPYLMPADKIEAMSNDQLTDLAEAQAEALRSHTWDANRLATELESVLTAALLRPANAGRSTPTTVARTAADTVTAEPQPVHREVARREGRRFDTTALRSDKHGKRVHRDYAAHFFKWGFATRLITPDDRVLEAGCGVEMPLPNVMTLGGRYVPQEYIGVDLNKISKPFNSKWAKTIDEFNFVDRWRELEQDHFTLAVSIEVIEHMGADDGKEYLKGIYNCLAPGGRMLLSTPVFNGKAAVNHVHEYTIDELKGVIETAGFTVDNRYGTFASYPELKKVLPADRLELLNELREFYSDEVTACFLAPLYPDQSRNNFWICRK